MVTTKLSLSMNEPVVRQVYAKEGDTGRVYEIEIEDETVTENGTLRILRPDGVEATSEAVTGGEVSVSGEVVTFDTLTEADVTELTVGIEPVQDLNGQANPYPAGGGKNLFNYEAWKGISITRGTAVFENNGVTLTATQADCYTKYLTSDYPNDAQIPISEGQTITMSWDLTSTSAGSVYIFPNGGTAGLVNTPASTKTLSYTATSGITFVTFRLGVHQSGQTIDYRNVMFRKSGDDTWQPYSNVCPITGHDEVNTSVVGKNLCDWKLNATANALSIYLPSGTYCISGETTPPSGAWYIRGTDANGNYSYEASDMGLTGWPKASSGWFYGNPNQPAQAFVVPNGCRKVEIGKLNADGTINAQLEKGSSATSFVPYNADSASYSTTLPSLVYGGTLDLVSGKLTVTHAIENLGDYTWTAASNNRFITSANRSLRKPPSSNGVKADIICTNYATQTYTSLVDATAEGVALNASSPNDGNICIRDTQYSDAAVFKTAMDGVMLCYALRTPTETTLTAQQVKTLVGTNNVWADSGDIISLAYTYGGIVAELPSEATEVVGRCIMDVDFNGASTLPCTLTIQKKQKED